MLRDLIATAISSKIIHESLEPIIRLLKEKTPHALLILQTITKALSDSTSIHDAIMRMQEGNSLLEVLSQKKSWQYIISRTFKKISVDEVEDIVNESLAKQVEIARRYSLLGKVLIIDQHEKAAWHKKHTECLVSINPKKKPNHKGHRFYTGAVAGPITVFTRFLIDRGNTSSGEAFQALMAYAETTLTISKVFIDAGFYSVLTYDYAVKTNATVVGIAPRNSRVSRIILDHHRGMNYHYEPGMYLHKIGDVSIKLVVVPRSREKRVISNDHDARRIVRNYVAFVVSRVPDGFPESVRSRGRTGLVGAFRAWAFTLAEDYRRRELIEVLYRLASLIDARIGAHYASLRFFIFGLALVIVNIYSLVRGVLRSLLFLWFRTSVRVVARAVFVWLRGISVVWDSDVFVGCFLGSSSRPPPRPDFTK